MGAVSFLEDINERSSAGWAELKRLAGGIENVEATAGRSAVTERCRSLLSAF